LSAVVVAAVSVLALVLVLEPEALAPAAVVTVAVVRVVVVAGGAAVEVVPPAELPEVGHHQSRFHPGGR
jgi:hypothetical protein